MKKLAKKFYSQVVDLNPSLSCVDAFFILDGTCHILSGFFCEATPGGVYLWKFVFPLFDSYGGFRLTYSEKLPYPKGYIDYSEIDRTRLAQVVSSRIQEELDGAQDSLQLSSFIAYYDKNSLLLDNPVILKTYAFALCLSGSYEKSLICLRKAIESKTIKNNENYFRKCSEILCLLEKGLHEDAAAILSRWSSELASEVGVERVCT